MVGRTMPGGPGGRVDPGGCDRWHAIDDDNHREAGQPRPGKRRKDRGGPQVVGGDVAHAAMRVAQCLFRRGNCLAAAVVVTGLFDGHACSSRRIQAAAMGRERELRPEQRRHRDERAALVPLSLAKAEHDRSLALAGPDATDPDQRRARPGSRLVAAASGFAGAAADLARRSALATTETELRLIASAATIGLSRIPNAG